MSEPTTIALRSPRKIEGLMTGSLQVLQLKTHFFGHILEMEDINFHLDSAVLLPDYGPDAPQAGTPDQNRITGLGVLFACYKHAVAHPNQKLLITGHTDRSGPSDYNLKLSDLRARNVLAVLKGERDVWAGISQDRHKVEDYQQILKWIAYTWGWDCDPGPKTEKNNDQTRKATESFQRQYNIEFDAFIPIDGMVNLPTWGAFFDIYMRELMTLLSTNKAGLEAYRSKLAFMEDHPESVGCGEFHPVTKDKNKTEIDRRVELLFFEPGEEPELKCHPEGGKCKPGECDLYGGKLYSFKHAEINPPVPTPPATTHSISISKVDSPHFIPDLEEITIEYQISGPMGRIQSVKLVAESEKEPGRRLFEKEIGVPGSPSSSTAWRGEATDPDFDGFLNLASAPYQVWMILTTLSGTACESNKIRVDVILDSIEMFVDDKGPIKSGVDDRTRLVIANLMASLAKNKGKGDVVLDSPLFKTRNSAMNDDSSFIEYQSMWGWGPSIPFFARIWLKGKDGGRKRGAKAIARTQVLWDLTLQTDVEFDATLKARKLDPPALAFLQKVTEFKKTESEPPGRTTHKHFGGQRTTSADRKTDEIQWIGINDDWNLVAPGQRTWASFTPAKAHSTYDADAGILFGCGRMAGDVHIITAYVDTDGSADTKDTNSFSRIAAARRSNSVTLSNRRRISVVKSYKVGKGTTDVDISTLTKEYDKAAITILPISGLTTKEVQADWKKSYQKVIASTARKDSFVADAALDDPELWPVKYRDFDDYLKRARARSKAEGRALAFFAATKKETYRKECNKHADQIYEEVAKDFPLGENGLTLFKFGANGEHNMWEHSFTSGIAPSIAGFTGPHKTLFFIFKSGKADDILVHEVGHQLFLAHAPGHFDSGDSRTDKDNKGNKIEQPGGFQPNAHADNQWCVMSYHKSEPKELCGLCILKLSGWLSTRINKDGTNT